MSDTQAVGTMVLALFLLLVVGLGSIVMDFEPREYASSIEFLTQDVKVGRDVRFVRRKERLVPP